MTAKSRILQFLEYKGVSKYSIEKKIGSNGFLSSGKEIMSDKLRFIYEQFADLNLVWVITGEGDMLTKPNANKVSHVSEPPAAQYGRRTEAAEKTDRSIIDRLTILLEKKEAELDELKDEIRDLKGMVGKVG